MMGEVSEHGAIFHPQGVWAQRGDGGVPSGPDGKESVCNTGDTGPIPGSGRSPGEGNSTHSSILTWEIPWTEEPGGLQFMGSLKSRA